MISFTSRFAITVLASLQLTTRLASAQSCYFPGGAVDNDSGVCAGSSVCCPLNWECMSNSLCYLPSEKYFQRSSCTDDSWGDECPQFCTKDDSGVENGNEAVAQCSDGSHCCDRNRPEVDDDDASQSCCALKVRSIDIKDGTATATISTKAAGSTKSSSATSATSTDGSSSSSTSTSSSSSPSSSTASSSSYSSRPPQTSVITKQAATTNSAGVATTIMVVTTAITTPTSTPSAHNSSPSLGTIVGIAIGIPVALGAAALLAFLLWRRHRDNKPAPSDAPTSERKDLVDMYNNTTHNGKPPEADGYPVASVTKPGHLSQPISEMSGSPAHGSQQYSPRSAVSPVTSKSFSNHYSNPPTANGLGFVTEEQPQELWGGDMPRQQMPPQPQPQPQDFAPMPPMPYGGGGVSYPGQPAPYQPAAPPYPPEPMQAGGKGGETRASGQYSAFQGVSEIADGKREIETAQSPPPGEDKMRIGQGLRVVNQ